MRSLRLLPLVFVAPVFLLPLACEDSSGSSSGATFNPEAGSYEAGPVPEAGVDSSPPAPLGVTVTVTDDALPKSAVRVLLHDGAGALIGEKATDATGKVTLPTAPSMVTVLVAHGTGAGSSVSPVTFAGVADGDKLVVAAVADVAPEPVSVGQYSVSFSSAGVAANATYFTVEANGTDCQNGGAPGAPVIVGLTASCLGAKNALLTTATNAAGLVGYGFTKDVAKPAAGPPPGNIDVGPQTFAAAGTTKLVATNVPQTVNTYSNLYALANGGSFPMGYGNGIVENGGFVYDTPVGFAEAYQARVAFDSYNVASTSTREIVRREAVPASNALTPVDFTTMLPVITDVPLTKPTAARPEVSFTTSGALTSTDGGVAVFRWSNQIAETNGSWTFVFPPSATGVKIPALPADATAFVPAADVSIDKVFFIEATQVPGYKELKLLPVKPNGGLDAADGSKPLPLPGTVRLSLWLPGVPG
jgi:hypothetical protein